MTKTRFTGTLLITSLVYLVLFFIGTGNFINYSVIIDIVVFLVFSILYLFVFRRDNLLCFELFVIPVLFIGLFFDDAMSNIGSIAVEFSGFSVNNENVRIKSHLLQMVAFLFFLSGSSISNLKWGMVNNKIEKGYIIKNKGIDNNYSIITIILSLILLLLLLYDYYTGIFESWFYYSNKDSIDGEMRNQGLNHIVCLSLALTTSEFYKLKSKRVEIFSDFIKKANKLYLIEILLVSILLFVSGNRNEMLLVLLPPVIAYTIFIHKIPIKYLLSFGLVGLLAMVIAGITRSDGVSMSFDSLNLYYFVRDFADIGYTTDYMIQWTDTNGPIYFKNFIATILSGVPLLGPMIIEISGIDFVSSASILGESVLIGGSFGSTLIGDLYYCGCSLFVILYMYFIGYLMSKLYYRLKISIPHNSFIVIFYLYMIANGIYYVRSSWDFPLTYIIYASIILYLCKFIVKVLTTVK